MFPVVAPSLGETCGEGRDARGVGVCGVGIRQCSLGGAKRVDVLCVSECCECDATIPVSDTRHVTGLLISRFSQLD